LGNIAAHEFGFRNKKKIKSNEIFFNYLCGVEHVKFGFNDFVVYQGVFKNNFLFFSNVNLIFPVQAFTERVSTYLNLEGRFRFSKIAVSSKLYSD
jgi:NADH dehydrogenase/NADH:ubiquinone oxidoreductase subunit G